MISVIGLHLDGWAHNNRPETEDSFFTPSHGVIYGGYFLISFIYIFVMYRNHKFGFTWRESMPSNYLVSYAGAAIFGIGGVSDMLWHETIGIEVSVEQIFSPPHIILFVSGFMQFTGPFLRMWHSLNRPSQSFKDQFLFLFPSAYMISVVIFMLQFAHPYKLVLPSDPNTEGASGYAVDGLGVMGFIFTMVVYMGLILMLNKRWRLAFGSLTLLFTLTSIFVSSQELNLEFIISGFVTGISADLLYKYYRIHEENLFSIRKFSFLVGTIFGLSFYLILELSVGIGWSFSLWIGSIVASAFSALLMSYLIYTLPIPNENKIQ